MNDTCKTCIVLSRLYPNAVHMYVFALQASLERIGVDSKGTVYWYDGGKNMFQSPPSNDPAYKPRYDSHTRKCDALKMPSMLKFGVWALYM